MRLPSVGVLLGLLLLATGGTAHIAAAQAPSLDADRPIQSLEQAVRTADSDPQLVSLATALQKARADTEISSQEYQRGVHLFRQHHPGFYGNFFGDPFYATYDARYMRLARKRQSVEPDINPENSFRNNQWFFCSPFAYDPAFDGQCRGTEFLVSDFFFLPAGPAFMHQDLASRRERVSPTLARRGTGFPIRPVKPASPTPDTSNTTIADTPDRPSPDRSAPDKVDAPPAVESDADLELASSVPDEIAPVGREAQAVLERAKAISRIRTLIRQQKNGDRLSIEERREMMSTLRHMARQQNAGRTHAADARSNGLQRRIELPRNQDRQNSPRDRSPRTAPDVNRTRIDRTQIDRSSSGSARSSRSNAKSDSPSSRNGSQIDTSGDEGQN
jgi:hypothetical protein